MSAIPRSLLMSRVFKPEPICKPLLAPRRTQSCAWGTSQDFCAKWERSSGCNPQKNPTLLQNGRCIGQQDTQSLIPYPSSELKSFPLFIHGLCSTVRLPCKVFPTGKGKGFPGHPVWETLAQTHPETTQSPASLPRPCPQGQHWHLSPPRWLCGWVKTSPLFRETQTGAFPAMGSWEVNMSPPSSLWSQDGDNFGVWHYLPPLPFESGIFHDHFKPVQVHWGEDPCNLNPRVPWRAKSIHVMH